MNEQEEIFSQKHKSLLNIATWAKYLASLALVVYIILALSIVFQKQAQFQQMQAMTGSFQGSLSYWESVKQDPFFYLVDIGLDMISVLLSGFFYFVVLKGISLGLNMIVETDINHRDKENQAGANLHKKIYSRFDVKETEELLRIWVANNRVEWSDVAFDVLEEILKKRINELPPQNAPILENHGDDLNTNLEEWEVKLLDDDNQPELYDTVEVLELKDNINKVAKAVVVVNIVVGIFSLQFVPGMFFGAFPRMEQMSGFLLNIFTTTLVVGINIAVTYFSLKALVHTLRILMEMEFNSRKAKS